MRPDKAAGTRFAWLMAAQCLAACLSGWLPGCQG